MLRGSDGQNGKEKCLLLLAPFPNIGTSHLQHADCLQFADCVYLGQTGSTNYRPPCPYARVNDVSGSFLGKGAEDRNSYGPQVNGRVVWLNGVAFRVKW